MAAVATQPGHRGAPHPAEDPAELDQPEWSASAVSAQGKFTGEAWPARGAPSPGAPHAWLVRLRTAAAEPVPSALVRATIVGPDGAAVAELEAVEQDGLYRLKDVVFAKPGDWRLRVTVVTIDARDEFEIRLHLTEGSQLL